jgi:ATP-dependent Clp protease adaptor protein ClpS
MPAQQPSSQPAVDQSIEERLRMLPRYRVVLLNDDFNDMDHVVRALIYTINALSLNDAIAIMLRAHTYGEAHVITCPLETAEFYAEGLKQFGLNSTIEPE